MSLSCQLTHLCLITELPPGFMAAPPAPGQSLQQGLLPDPKERAPSFPVPWHILAPAPAGLGNCTSVSAQSGQVPLAPAGKPDLF